VIPGESVCAGNETAVGQPYWHRHALAGPQMRSTYGGESQIQPHTPTEPPTSRPRPQQQQQQTTTTTTANNNNNSQQPSRTRLQQWQDKKKTRATSQIAKENFCALRALLRLFPSLPQPLLEKPMPQKRRTMNTADK